MKRILALASIACLAAAVLAGQGRSASDLFQEGLRLEEVKGDLQAAIRTYQAVAERFPADRATAAKAQLHIGLCYERMGKAEAAKAYEKVLRDYADQKEPAAQAKHRLASLEGSGPRPADGAVVARQVWTGADVDLEGKPSSDGRLITFIDWRSTRSGNVAIRTLATGENRLLTHSNSFSEGYGEYPVLSPDGRYVAFGWYNDEGQSIKVAGSDGSRPRVLMQRAGTYMYDLTWSPDGRRIAGIVSNSGGDRTSQIVLLSASDGTMTPVKSLGSRQAALGGFSPDGRFLVYSVANSGSDGEGGIYAMTVDGTRESAVAKGAANDSSAVWTADGSAVVFVSDRSGTPGLWSIRVDDGKPRGNPELVRPNVGQLVNMGFARDGSWFYGTRNGQTDVFQAVIDPQTLDVTGQPARLSDQFVGSNSSPQWSPDGRFVAFVRGPDRRSKTLVVRSLSDGAERVLPTKLRDGFFATQQGPRWFPDSRSLLIPDRDDSIQRTTFRRIDIDTGKETPVFDAPFLSVWPLVRIAPDGRSLYFTRREPAANVEESILRLVRRDLDSGRETELYRAESGGAGLFALCLSADGSQLSFMQNVTPPGSGRSDDGRRVVMALPTSGGPPRELFRGDYSHPAPFAGVWTKDGRYVLVASEDTPQRMRVWAIPTAGGEPKKLDLTMERLSALDLSPDGRTLVFTGARTRPELWSVTNLLPNARASK